MKITRKNVFLGILLLFFIFLYSYEILFLTPLQEFDELWNYQTTYKMSIGLSLYKDINCIITPLFFTIGKIFLLLGNKSLIAYRYYCLISVYLYVFLFYKILKNLNIPTTLSLLYTILAIIFALPAISSGANYNTISMILIFLYILTYLKYYNKKSYYYLIGIELFLIFITKQNIFVYMSICTFIYEATKTKKISIFIKNMLKIFSTFAPLFLLFIWGLYHDHLLNDFINYTIKGLQDFSENNFGYELEALIIFCSLLTSTIVTKILLYKFRDRLEDDELKEKVNYFFYVIIFSSLSLYPIINDFHFHIIEPLFVLYLFYFNTRLFFTENNEVKLSPKLNNKLIIITIILVIIHLLRIYGELYINISSNKTKIISNNSNNQFYNIMTSTEILERYDQIKTFTDEINSQNTNSNIIILDTLSALVNIPINNFHNNYDLCFYGNLGENGLEKIKSEIGTTHNTYYIILTDSEKDFWQFPKEIREYIEKNLTFIKKSNDYSIYFNE